MSEALHWMQNVISEHSDIGRAQAEDLFLNGFSQCQIDAVLGGMAVGNMKAAGYSVAEIGAGNGSFTRKVGYFSSDLSIVFQSNQCSNCSKIVARQKLDSHLSVVFQSFQCDYCPKTIAVKNGTIFPLACIRRNRFGVRNAEKSILEFGIHQVSGRKLGSKGINPLLFHRQCTHLSQCLSLLWSPTLPQTEMPALTSQNLFHTRLFPSRYNPSDHSNNLASNCVPAKFTMVA